MFRMVALCLASLAATAQTSPELAPDVLRLAKVKRHMREMLLKQVNYTCQMSIQRSARLKPRRAFRLIDQVRLEVALVDGKELFSWPGARKFDDRELRHMLGGTTSTGSFASHARAIFFGAAPVFRYNGEQVLLDGSRVFEWSFDVAQPMSNYVMRITTAAGDRQATVGYRGIVQVHPQTLDLVRLKFEALDIPPHLALQSAGDDIEYRRQRIGEADYLLPASSDLRMIDIGGNESRNETRFHNCRQYAGESAIRFDEPPPETEANVPVKPPPTLPPGMWLELQLVEAVPLEKAAIGDRIEAKLGRPARYKGIDYLPKGTLFTGRVLGVRPVAGRTPAKAVTLIFDRFETDSGGADISLSLDDVTPASFGATRYAVRDGAIHVQGPRSDLIRGLNLFWTVKQWQLQPPIPALP